MGFPNIYLMWRGHCLLVAHRQPAGPVAVVVCVYIGFHSQPVSLGVPYRPLYTPALGSDSDDGL